MAKSVDISCLLAKKRERMVASACERDCMIEQILDLKRRERDHTYRNSRHRAQKKKKEILVCPQGTQTARKETRKFRTKT